MQLLARLRSRPKLVPELPEPAQAETPGEPERDLLRETCEMLEAELDSAVADTMRKGEASAAALARAEQEVSAIVGEMREAAQIAAETSHNVGSVATATDELSAAGREIASQASASTASARAVLGEAERAGSTMSGLRQAVLDIGEVVHLIGEIAERTNLLALNATIEAARAGEAGRGFAVVASEVKALSRQTTTATEDVGRRIQQIQTATTAAVQAVEAVQQAAHDIDRRSTAVAAAVEEQDATISGIARTVEQVAQSASSVAERAGLIATHCDSARVATGVSVAAVMQTCEQIQTLRQTMIVSLRSSTFGDRQAHVRVPVRLPVSLRAPGLSAETEILDISEGGMLIGVAPSFPVIADMTPVEAHTPRLGTFSTTLLGRSAGRLHLAFCALSSQQRNLVRDLVAATMAADQVFITAARAAAGEMSRLLQMAVDRCEISESALFDTQYQPIPHTNPPQCLAPFTDLADRLFPPIQENLLGLDPREVFAVAVDCNGYLPTHNRAVSQPQRPDDPTWNAANCRNRRIFNDRAGLAAGRSTRPFLLQTYERDMGGGMSVLMKEADAPIQVCGRHWGGFRLAYHAEGR